ncbi:MAG: hypothetical protein ACXWUG_10165 [Polyangiales bacterium]
MAHDAHDDHHALPAVDGDDLPAHGPVLAEPHSPAWLPYLGAAFFGLLLIFWLASPSEEDEAKAAAAAASASASASASAAASAPPPAPEH